MTQENATTAPYVVAALYHFSPLTDLKTHQEHILTTLKSLKVKGLILLADEGVNGTIAGSRDGIGQALACLRALPGCANLEHKESYAAELPFLRMKVKLKKEIVTMGVPDVDPNEQVGQYVAPENWNDVINDPDTVLIDTRNDYEVAIGTFKGAIDPKTDDFRQFPAWFEKFVSENKPKRVAMFCTGGIRCEKATSFARKLGVEDVVHLKGGILKYLEHVPKAESTWEGECFVFDNRVAVTHGLKEGSYDQCYACRYPINEEMKASPKYEYGISCPLCFDKFTPERRERFAERQKQMAIAEKRGIKHIGGEE